MSAAMLTSRHSLTLVKAIKVAFYPFDTRTSGLRELIASSNSTSIRKLNPKFAFTAELLKAPTDPKVVVTFANNEEFVIPAAKLKVDDILEEITMKNVDLTRSGVKSDLVAQALKDMETGN